MPTNTIEKVLATYGLTTQSPSLDVLIFDEIPGGGIGIPVIKLLEEVDETARADQFRKDTDERIQSIRDTVNQIKGIVTDIEAEMWDDAEGNDYDVGYLTAIIRAREKIKEVLENKAIK